jgi:hypothetical protein
VRAAKLHALNRNASRDGQSDKQIANSPEFRRKSTIRTLLAEYAKYEDDLLDANTRTFNIFDFVDKVGREATLPILSVHYLITHHLDVYTNDRKLAVFLTEIYKGYKRTV